MHQIPAYEPSVTLFHRDGDVWVYRSLSEAYDALGYHWLCENVGEEFRMFSHSATRMVWSDAGYVPVSEPTYIEAEFIMRDDFGNKVTSKDFYAIKERRRKPYLGWFWSRYASWNGEGPVPGVHKYKAGWHYCRRIRHMNERRWAIPMEDEPAPRPKRNRNNLQNPWDDYTVAAREDRNWKRHRRTQWRA